MSNQTITLPLVPLRSKFIPSEARDLEATERLMGARSFGASRLRIK
jgi:hypothetical protein